MLQNKQDAVSALDALSRLPNAQLDACCDRLEELVWREVDCLDCAYCCKAMIPYFNNNDVKRIATRFRLSVQAFRKKYLQADGNNRWKPLQQPCPFLDLSTNACTVYEIRPDCCRAFPHLHAKPVTEYLHVHRQNVHHCPATQKFVEKMQELMA